MSLPPRQRSRCILTHFSSVTPLKANFMHNAGALNDEELEL